MSIASNFPAISPSLNLSFALTKELDPRITFTRASTATYYGTQTAKAEENLLLQSQDFTTSWSNTSSSDTANTSVAPDGTTTADTVTAAAGTAITPLVSQGALGSTSGLTYVFSVFAKAGTYSVLQLTNINFQASSAHANFDLSAGTVGTSANCTASIQNAGSGWYRCIIVFSATATVTNGAVYAVLSASTSANRFATWNPVGTETILLWGAQLEQRSAVTAYTPTTTQPITNYIPQLLTAASGVARFDHNPTTFESLGLLIEEQRTNLFTYSEDFANAAWTKASSAITTNAVFSPDGTLDADKLVENATNNAHYVGLNAGTIGNPEVFSFYAKAAERTWCAVQIGSSGVAYYDLQNGALGTVTNSTASIVSVGNGWFRCSISATRAVNTNNFIYSATANNTVSYTGNGFSGIYIWGAQLEAGAFPTSYIPTVASQVTRAADAASMTGANFSSWYNQAEGTLYSDAITLAPIPAARAFASINDNTSNNRWTSAVTDNSGVAAIRPFRNTNGAGLLFTPAPSGAANTTQSGNKVALAITNYEASICFNGGTSVTTTNTYLAPVVTQMQIGQQIGASFLNGTIRKLAYYPLRLSNTNIQALTS